MDRVDDQALYFFDGFTQDQISNFFLSVDVVECSENEEVVVAILLNDLGFQFFSDHEVWFEH